MRQLDKFILTIILDSLKGEDAKEYTNFQYCRIGTVVPPKVVDEHLSIGETSIIATKK